jgi:hypothetical protein
MDRHSGIRPALSDQVIVRSGGGYQTRSQTITLPELPSVASFFVGGDAFPILNGLGMVWRTRGPIR